MNLDELLESWRSQDQRGLYVVNADRLQQAMRQEQAKWRRYLRIENWITYGMSAALVAGLAFIFLLMVYDDDPRTVLDFVIVSLGLGAAVLWGGSLYLSRRMHALRERQFGSSLREEIARHLALVDYLMARVWRRASALLTTLPLFFGVMALWLAIGLVNNEPFRFDAGSIVAFLVMGVTMVYVVYAQRKAAEQELLPRKRRLEALIKELDETS